MKAAAKQFKLKTRASPNYFDIQISWYVTAITGLVYAACDNMHTQEDRK